MSDAVDWLYGLQHFGIKLGLGNIRTLLEIHGLPHAPCRFVHVAGTNGKGSVAAMVDSMLGASGVRSGLYTSPHLVRPNERIRIAGEDIADEALDCQLAIVRETIDRAIADGRLSAHPSFFEAITATALRAFAEARVEATVLEVGLGGRLDATNAIDAEIGVVVGLDLDHTSVLGSTLEEIAAEKAGIVKPGMMVVSGVTQQRAIDVVRDACDDRGATFVEARTSAELVSDGPAGIEIRTRRNRYQGLRLALDGRHQIGNARIALVAFELVAERLGIEPAPARVREGLAHVRWPGRLAWRDPGDGGARFLLDGAHNPAGMRALAAHLDRAGLPKPVLLFGATAGRPVDELLEPLAGRIEHAVLTRAPVERALDPAAFAELARATHGSIETVEDTPAAIARARARAGTARPVLVAGSLYLVGAVLSLLEGRAAPGPVAM